MGIQVLKVYPTASSGTVYVRFNGSVSSGTWTASWFQIFLSGSWFSAVSVSQAGTDGLKFFAGSSFAGVADGDDWQITSAPGGVDAPQSGQLEAGETGAGTLSSGAATMSGDGPAHPEIRSSIMMVFKLLLLFTLTVFSLGAITHATATRTALAQATKDACGASFKLKIRDSGNTNLLIISGLDWSSPSSGSMTVNPISTGISTSGTAANFIMTTSSDVTVISGTVTATGGGGDLTVSNTAFISGVFVDFGTITYNAAN